MTDFDVYPAFLSVEESLTGRRWTGSGPELDRQAEAMEQSTRLPLPLCRILARRRVQPEEAVDFLDPKLNNLLPDPLSLIDMDAAADRLLSALRSDERIAIFADYDVDGGSCAALLLDWLREQGRDATLYVPDRIQEGYGPNAPAMRTLAESHDLIICVDCGAQAHEAVAAASRADVVVIDHHLGAETLPPACAVVNPNRVDETGDLGHLCAASVVFLLLVEANRRLRAQGVEGPDLMGLLDLVALATVADMSPLAGVNRAFVRQGLKVMARRARPGLAALCDISRLTGPPAPYHLGFALGPRINAGGRVGKAELGARLLSTSDPHEAVALAEDLDKLNQERRQIEAAVQVAAFEQAEARGFDAPLVWAAHEKWHPGVAGIVATRLKDAANRPAVVIGAEGKGSGRSVPGIDLGAAVIRAASEGLLLGGGGHQMAAGLTVAADRLDAAMGRLSELLAHQGADALGPRLLALDGLLMPEAVTIDLIEDMERAGPFGISAPAPRFAFPEQPIGYTRRIGANHLAFSFGDRPRIDAIAFNAYDGQIGPALQAHGGARFHLAGRLEVNEWGGRRRPRLRLHDVAEALA